MITPTTAVIILIIALIIFGPGKLPQLGKSLGKTIKEFKSEVGADEAQAVAENNQKENAN